MKTTTEAMTAGELGGVAGGDQLGNFLSNAVRVGESRHAGPAARGRVSARHAVPRTNRYAAPVPVQPAPERPFGWDGGLISLPFLFAW